jgi:hypothetical protein
VEDEFTPENPNIFISYAHIDNEEPPEWIDSFAEELRRKVMVRLGARPTIWKDRYRLSGNDVLQEIILPAARNAMVIVSVISPGYLTSAWCKSELNAFVEAHQAGDLSIRGRSRVFKVVKLPPEDIEALGKLPELLDTTGDMFYSHDGRKAVSWDPTRDADKFKEKVDDVALAIVQILGAVLGTNRHLVPSGLKIYLAPSTYDLHDQRERLRNTLRLSGHAVLETEPVYTSDYEYRVRTQLERSHMSLHLIGDNYATLENSNELVEATAYRLANEAAMQRPEFVRVTWRMSKVPPDERKREFVARLTDDVAQDNMQYVVMPREELESYLKDVAHNILKSQRPAEPEPPPVPSPSPSPSLAHRTTVYMTWDPADDESSGETIAAVRRYLFEQQFDVKRQLVGADPTKAAEFHQRMLRTCDAVLLYQGAGDPAWVESTIADLEDPAKGRGFGSNGYRGCALLFGPPQTPYKGDYLSHDVPGIALGAQWDPSVLAPFMTLLRGVPA